MLRAFHSIELLSATAGNSQWVQLLPAGEFSGYDGRGPYVLQDAQGVIDLTARNSIGRDLPVDYDHQSEFSEKNGKPAPAAGWIKQFEARADGIYGRIEWTDKALAAIQSKEFRYISPVFIHSRAGQIKRIVSAGLTNQPNLQMKALSSQQNQHQGHDMDELQKLLIKLFGMADDATAEQISAHAQKLIDGNQEIKTLMSSLSGSLGIKEDASADDVVKAVQSAVASKDAAAKDDPDPAKFVPMQAFRDLQDTVKSLQSQSLGAAADSAVEKALADKKITPAQADWARSYHKADPKGFDDFIAKAPALNIDSAIVDQNDPKGGGSALNAAEKAVCSQLGMSEEDFIKSRGDQTQGDKS